MTVELPWSSHVLVLVLVTLVLLLNSLLAPNTSPSLSWSSIELANSLGLEGVHRLVQVNVAIRGLLLHLNLLSHVQKSGYVRVVLTLDTAQIENTCFK